MAFPKTQDLARRLITSQAVHNNAAESAAAEVAAVEGAAAEVVAELRTRLIKLAGVDGFRSLLARALALAKQEAPSLCDVQVHSDSTLLGFEAIEPQAAATEEAETVLVAFLLELLVTFIGEPLTMRLVRDAWKDAVPCTTPNALQNKTQSNPEGTL